MNCLLEDHVELALEINYLKIDVSCLVLHESHGPCICDYSWMRLSYLLTSFLNFSSFVFTLLPGSHA